MYYDLIDYFDVWGSSEGWEVNNLCIVEENIYIDPTSTDEEILQFLVDIGYFNENAIESAYVISYDPEFIEIFQKYNDLPLCRLQKHYK